MNKSQPNKKKIIIISVAKNWGGGEQFILDLCSNLTDFDFIILSAKGNASKLLKQNGLRVKAFSHLKKVEKSNGRWSVFTALNILYNVTVNFFILIKCFYAEQPDLIIMNGNMAGLYSFLPAVVSKKRFVVIQHLIYQAPTFEKFIIKILIRYAEAFVCVSNAVAENLFKYWVNKKWQSKIHVIYNGVHINDFPYEIKSERETIRLGFIGAIKKEKGLELIIDALAKIPSELNYQLVIFSDLSFYSGSAYLGFIKQLISVKNLMNKLVFKEFTTDKNKMYEEIDILINYSLVAEAFPYVILEAMSRGKIVIASNEGGPKEIIKHSENGFLVEPQNSQLLSETISKCISEFNSENLNLISANAFRTIKDKFSIDKFTKNYKDFFNSIIN